MNAVAQIISRLLQSGHKVNIELMNHYSDTEYIVLKQSKDGSLFQIADDNEGGYGVLEASGFKADVTITNNKVIGRYWCAVDNSTYDFILTVPHHDIISLLFTELA